MSTHSEEAIEARARVRGAHLRHPEVRVQLRPGLCDAAHARLGVLPRALRCIAHALGGDARLVSLPQALLVLGDRGGGRALQCGELALCGIGASAFGRECTAEGFAFMKLVGEELGEGGGGGVGVNDAGWRGGRGRGVAG